MKSKQNTIERSSIESSVTIPFEATFRDLDMNRPSGGKRLERFNFCGCGWPQHMLIPRGATDGFQCVLFVMISNIDDDRVGSSSSKFPPNRQYDDYSRHFFQVEGAATSNQRGFDDAASYCGVKDSKYPDRRPMGFPFDRPPR